MEIYKGIIEFNDGRKFEDIWVNEEDALAYYQRAPYFIGCKRAELFEMQPDDNNLQYVNKKCIYEFDVSGKYFYNVGQQKEVKQNV